MTILYDMGSLVEFPAYLAPANLQYGIAYFWPYRNNPLKTEQPQLSIRLQVCYLFWALKYADYG